MKYGLPYKGSKNKLAERIVRLLPKRTHLVDLFCGGCAVSHAALLMGKYEHIHINDINWMCPTLFIDALNGKYNNENRWISREDFFRLKDTDPYVAFVWSFGNNLRDYLYSREIEPLKKAIHYAIFFSDYSFCKEIGHDLSFIAPIQNLQERYRAVKHYFNKLATSSYNRLRGGESADAVCRSLGTTQHQFAELGGRKDWQRLDTMERQTPLRIATLGRYQPSAAIQKKTTSAPANWNTTNDETSSYRLQHREDSAICHRFRGVFAHNVLCA